MTGNRRVSYAVPAAGLLLAAMSVSACGGAGTKTGSELSGTITGDGSSTVYPITEAMAEEFTRAHPGGRVRVTVGLSGTGGGFKRFCTGDIDISNASRPIKESERAICAQNGVEFLELPIAYDGLSVVANPRNTFVTCLTTAELKKIWEPGSRVNRWSQVRDGFPDEDIKLYGAGTASGTFDYFTEAIMGTEDMSRSDYTASEDDNVLVQGVAGDARALGYFGYAYYTENQQRVKAVAVDNGSGCVTPSPETIKNGTYAPLSRPLLLYINRRSLERPEIQAFLTFFNENAAELVPQVGYVALDDAQYQKNIEQLGSATTQ